MKVVPVLGGELLIPDRFQPGIEPFTVSMHFWLGDRSMMRAFAKGRLQRRALSERPCRALESVPAASCRRSGSLRSNPPRHRDGGEPRTVSGAPQRPHRHQRLQRRLRGRAGDPAEPVELRADQDPDHADTIYADWVSGEVRVPRLEQMAHFMQFAQASARGERTMITVVVDWLADAPAR
jgi:hypothetical protein